MKKLILFSILAGSISFALEAQDKGYLSGSFETNSNLYQDDLKTGAIAPEGSFGSNNYLKLDYHTGKFTAGIQIEGYFPSAVGYPDELSGVNLSNLYAQWQDEDFSITAGTFYDQFGSGLLFRSWEDRALGLNNAIMGARFTYSYKDIVSFKALWGMPRFGMGIFTPNVVEEAMAAQINTETQVRGADLSFVLSNLCNWNSLYLSLEGSVLNRYEPISVDLMEFGAKPNSIGYSARLNMEAAGFFFKGEYVDAGNKYYANPDRYSTESYLKKKANAQLVELGYNGRGLGVTLTGRRIEWMSSKILSSSTSSSNMMNYIPAMCTQYTYMLTTHHPYNPQPGNMTFANSGEMGGQLDAFYNFRRGTVLGGKRGMKVHANFSTYYTIEKEGTFNPGNLLFRDFSFDVEKQFNKQFKMVLLYSLQQYNDSYGVTPEYMTQHIGVADLLYKFTSKFSARLELQYLHTKQDKKDWMAALLEVNFAPRWSIYASDMYNHGKTKVHYYNAGVSYAKGRTRVALGYGRYKAGFICSGGVCRSIPAYTGANFSVTTSF